MNDFPNTLQPNQQLKNGTYTIEKVLGRGGFGITYKATYRTTIAGSLGEMSANVSVAVKELFVSAGNMTCTRNAADNAVNPNFDKDNFQKFKDRFLLEARTLAKFRGQQGIVQVIDMFEENNTNYFVMEYIEGQPLGQYVKNNGRLSETKAIEVLRQLLNVLAVVHQKELLHRDINPNNIIINNDKLVLIDFGISKSFEENVEITQSTFFTPVYSAPEQKVQKALRGAFTDLYSVGATLFFMLTGQRPQNDDEISLDGYQSARDLNPSISANMNEVIEKAMRKRPAERFQSANEFMAALNGLNNHAHNDTPFTQIDNGDDDVFDAIVTQLEEEQKPAQKLPPITPQKEQKEQSQPKKEEVKPNTPTPRPQQKATTNRPTTNNNRASQQRKTAPPAEKNSRWGACGIFLIIIIVAVLFFFFAALNDKALGWLNEQTNSNGVDYTTLIQKDYKIIGDPSDEKIQKIEYSDGKQGFVDANDKIIEGEYDQVGEKFRQGLAWVQRDGKRGYINTSGALVVPFQFDKAGSFFGNRAYVGKKDYSGNYKYGFIDKSGNLVVDYLYEDANGFRNGRARVQQNGVNFLIDANGNQYTSTADIEEANRRMLESAGY